MFTIFLVVGMQSDGQVFGDSFDRYFTIFRYLSEQDDVFFAIDLATSGRLFDAIAVIEVLGDNVFRWIFGMGFGATYDIYYSFADEVHTTHYSHVAPLSYIFLGGILFAFAAFGKVLYEGAHALNNYDNHLSLMILYFLIMSVSGANLFTDVFWWIIIGAFTARRLQNRY
jgi:Ca2+/Na+ antiporter